MSLVRYIGSWEYKCLTKFPFLKKYDANRFVRNGIPITNTFKVYNTGTTRRILCIKIVTEVVRSEVIYQWHVPVSEVHITRLNQQYALLCKPRHPDSMTVTRAHPVLHETQLADNHSKNMVYSKVLTGHSK